MIRCVAIDDEPKALEIIRSHISRVSFLELTATFHDPFLAVEYLQDHPVDLIFLDINMPGIDGIRLSKNLRTQPLIIFTTAHSEYAVQSYEVEAVDYLLKPFDFARFQLAASKAKDRFSSTEKPTSVSRDFFFVNTGYQKRRIVFSDISYVVSDGNYVRYQLRDNHLLVRSSIRETLHVLPGDLFCQIHRSYIVSIRHIEKIEDNHVHIADQRIAIGSKYRDDFLKRI